MSSRHVRCLVALIALVAVALMSSPSEARGGRGGRGGGGGRAGGGRPSAGLSGASGSRNLGGQLSNAPGGFAGSQQLQGALGQAGQGGFQQSLGSRASEGQSLQNKFQQQASQWQQRATGERSGEAGQNLQNQVSEFQNGPEPFSPAWYAEHPQAWQYTHPHADAAAVATAAGVATWIGAAYYAPAESGGSSSTTVIYQEVPSEEAAPQETASQVQPETIASGAAPIPGEWLPLGTYSLATNRSTPPTLMLQLAVDRGGQIKGVYYDSLTNTTHNISGTLDRSSQVAQWSLDTNQQLAFSAPVDELLKPTGSVSVKLATGPQQWQLVRIEEN